MQVYLLLLYAIIGGLWRRAYGTSGHRAIETVFLFVIACVMIISSQNIPNTLVEWFNSVLSIILFYISIAHGHHDYYDIFGKHIDDKRNKIVDWFLKKIFGKDNYYNFFGNFVGLFLTRILWTTLAGLCLPKPYFVFFAIAYPLSYAIAQGITKPNGEEHYISASEYTVGFCYFGLFYLSLMG